MTKPTAEELQTKTNQELNELVAVAQGWYKDQEQFYSVEQWYSSERIRVVSVKHYQPTEPTEQGESQCWKLMVKCKMTITYLDVGAEVLVYGICKFYDKDPQRAAVIAAILYLQEQE
ncbi:MAG: hypothetical protein GQ570_03640 [Helicobacteraceae bacterium]|nr:hypothetical protein [Helicobacteraceae bacterium]